ncbi:hypothetical protein BDZ89DRAFT_978408 [Hymenopellis radicata]|nr:hypothetical protein BDZ89DRAFT_978408 [Hymenopellis radicata]
MASPYPQDNALIHRSQDNSVGVHRSQKRRGGQLSCSECRRLKLKCSRVFPCSNCVKKGCGPICPDGSLTTGKGNRFVLANTEALHDKIGQLSTRVRQLEDALAESHALNSPQPHALLTEELLQIKRPLERERLDSQAHNNDTAENADAINALGSLSLSERGKSTFFGSTANSWYLLKNEEGSEEEEVSLNFRAPIPNDVPWLAQSFPFASTGSESAESIRASLISFLPPEPQARRLCDLYYRHAAWMYTPISNQDFLETIYRPVYGQDSMLETFNPQSLALLFMVLAMGTLMDLEQPAHSPQATQYYHLGRAALAIKSVFDEQSIPGIQALLIMCHFMFWNDEGARWVVMGIVVKLAQSVGLHRDSGKWNLNPEETYRRRCLLWEIFVYDSWQSLTYGRPPSFSIVHVDTKMPHEDSSSTATEGEMTFAAWKHSFASQCQAVVHDQAFGARPPSYKTLQELDKKVRSYYVPPSLQVPGFGGAKLGPEIDRPTTELTMQRYIAFAIKEMTLFYMHRGFFAQALEDCPTDPMGSKYAQSVLAAYTSACSFVGLIESLFKQHPALTERMWFLFTHVFSCSIVLGSIAVKAEMALAPSALSHLESAYQLFSQVSESSQTVKILNVLHKLKERAHAAISKARGHVLPNHRIPHVKTEASDELAGLGGMTRLVSRRTSSLPSSPSSNAGSSPASQPASPPLSQNSNYQPIHDPAAQWSYTPMQQDYDYPVYSQADGSMPYNVPQSQHGMTLDVMPHYYGYGSNGHNVRVGFGQFSMQHSLPSEFSAPPDHDLNLSWQNFMSQYKPI